MKKPLSKENKLTFRVNILKKLTDDNFRYYFQMCVLCALLAVVAAVMSIMNIFTSKTELLYATLFFSVVMLVNLLVLLRVGHASHFSYAIFEVGMFVLFGFFLITGGTEGFSPYWIIILPSFGMMFLGKKRGLWLNVVMFAMVVFMLMTPWGRELQRYRFTDEFCMRFPVVYVATFALGYCFEMIRLITYNALTKAQRQLIMAAETDQLTKLHNRHWFNQRLYEKLDNKVMTYDCAVAIIDIDKFKTVNDVHGHLSGDEALAATANAIDMCMRKGDASCRWGGEEFFVYFDTCAADQVPYRCEDILETVRKIRLVDSSGKEFRITVSIGAVGLPAGKTVHLRDVFLKADERLYRAKNAGRDKAIYD